MTCIVVVTKNNTNLKKKNKTRGKENIGERYDSNRRVIEAATIWWLAKRYNLTLIYNFNKGKFEFKHKMEGNFVKCNKYINQSSSQI